MISTIAEKTLLDQFVRSCVFIHDDWIPAAGRADWGAYDTNPFLLGADFCVITTLKGFGQDYLDYLQDLNSLPEHIIVPEHSGDNLTLNLLQDQEALGRLRALVQEHRLDMSVFYNDDQRGLDALMQALTSPAHRPALYPTKTSFNAVNRKIDAMRLVRSAGVPTPESAVCESLDEVMAFYQRGDRQAQTVILKEDHRKFLIATTEVEVRQASTELSYPLLVETLLDVKVSPSLNMVKWQGELSPFVVSDQVLSDRAHRGNILPSRVSPAVADKIERYTARIGEAIPGLQGVFGVDYIVTPNDDVYAVDINPRFCSGTYPLHFLQRMGVDLGAVHAHYQLAFSNVDSLSAVLNDPDFVPFTPDSPEGIFIYDPVVYEEGDKPVFYYSYLAVSESAVGLAALESRMEAIIAKHPMPF